MGLETTTDIEGLDNTWPLSGDGATDGAAHIKLLKSVLKGIFQGAGGQGFNTAIVSTEAEWNFCQGIASNVQQQINALKLSTTPLGSIHMWNSANPIPSGWLVCDGANGTPNLVDQFIMCTTLQAEMRLSGGFSEQITVAHDHTQTHTHVPSVETKPDHSHFANSTTPVSGSTDPSSDSTFYSSPVITPRTTIETVATSHTHAYTINAHNTGVANAGVAIGTPDTNLPTYTTLIFIKSVS